MMLLLSRCRFHLLFAFLAFASLRSFAQSCSGFQRGSVDDAYIVSHFNSAIISLSGLGTAYLVDAENGYLITATHVLADVAAAHKSLTATSPLLPGVSAPLHQVGKVDVKDVTLLQLDTPDLFKDLVPIDISFSPPEHGSNLFAMGYPLFGDQSGIQLRYGDATMNGVTDSGLLEVAHVTERGSSGGPLFNRRGEAIGTCHEEIDDGKIGRYVVTSDLSKLFRYLPVSAKMKSIEAQLTNGILNAETFKLLLLSAKTPSNLELYVWLQHAASTPGLDITVKKYLACPIEPALIQRGMADALTLFIPGMPEAMATEVQISLAEKEFALGHDKEAYDLIAAADQGIAKISDPRQTAEVLLLKGNISQRLGLNTDARSSFFLAKQNADILAKAEGMPKTQQADLFGRIDTSLGRVHYVLGQPEQASVYYRNAIKSFSLSGNQLATVSLLRQDAKANATVGDYSQAVAQTRQAGKLAMGIGDSQLKYDIWMDLGTFELKSGDSKDALINFRRAKAVPNLRFDQPQFLGYFDTTNPTLQYGFSNLSDKFKTAFTF